MEQSDVIIKVGSWERRFHWDVLVASPFFEDIHRRKKHTGLSVVELNRWPASAVEQTILFLYGREPDVYEWNVHDLLAIADFLSIQALELGCIEFLCVLNEAGAVNTYDYVRCDHNCLQCNIIEYHLFSPHGCSNDNTTDSTVDYETDDVIIVD